MPDTAKIRQDLMEKLAALRLRALWRVGDLLSAGDGAGALAGLRKLGIGEEDLGPGFHALPEDQEEEEDEAARWLRQHEPAPQQQPPGQPQEERPEEQDEAARFLQQEEQRRRLQERQQRVKQWTPSQRETAGFGSFSFSPPTASGDWPADPGSVPAGMPLSDVDFSDSAAVRAAFQDKQTWDALRAMPAPDRNRFLQDVILPKLVLLIGREWWNRRSNLKTLPNLPFGLFTDVEGTAGRMMQKASWIALINREVADLFSKFLVKAEPVSGEGHNIDGYIFSALDHSMRNAAGAALGMESKRLAVCGICKQQNLGQKTPPALEILERGRASKASLVACPECKRQLDERRHVLKKTEKSVEEMEGLLRSAHGEEREKLLAQLDKLSGEKADLVREVAAREVMAEGVSSIHIFCIDEDCPGPLIPLNFVDWSSPFWNTERGRASEALLASRYLVRRPGTESQSADEGGVEPAVPATGAIRVPPPELLDIPMVCPYRRVEFTPREARGKGRPVGGIPAGGLLSTAPRSTFWKKQHERFRSEEGGEDQRGGVDLDSVSRKPGGVSEEDRMILREEQRESLDEIRDLLSEWEGKIREGTRPGDPWEHLPESEKKRWHRAMQVPSFTKHAPLVADLQAGLKEMSIQAPTLFYAWAVSQADLEGAGKHQPKLSQGARKEIEGLITHYWFDSAISSAVKDRAPADEREEQQLAAIRNLRAFGLLASEKATGMPPYAYCVGELSERSDELMLASFQFPPSRGRGHKAAPGYTMDVWDFRGRELPEGRSFVPYGHPLDLSGARSLNPAIAGTSWNGTLLRRESLGDMKPGDKVLARILVVNTNSGMRLSKVLKFMRYNIQREWLGEHGGQAGGVSRLDPESGMLFETADDGLFAEDGALSSYKKKRDFEETPEPEGEAAKENKHRFVIQRHKAKRAGEHFDLRLENDRGAMTSWSIPKHKLPSGKEKLLAVRTEDHPISYMKFKGEIPEGEYGAGTMSVHDSGTYDEVERSDSKLVFRLKGKKEKGTYKIFKTDGKRWMIMEAEDESEADDGDRQEEKEEAVRLAMRLGMALIRRGLDVVGIRADGEEEKLLTASSMDRLWSEAADKLREMGGEEKCLTSGAVFHTAISDDKVEVSVDLPEQKSVSGAQAGEMEDDLHRAVEQVLFRHLFREAAARAVVILGNPRYIGNERADRFYREIGEYLEAKGMEVQYDPGLPYTQPAPGALLWIGHSRGSDRLRFAPPGVKTLALGSSAKGAVNHPKDKFEIPPVQEHFIFTDEMKKAVDDLLPDRPAQGAKDGSAYVEKKKQDSGNITYLYSKEHVDRRNRRKMRKLKKLNSSLSKLRKKVREDLKSDDPQKCATALAVAVIDETYARIGNDRSAEGKKALEGGKHYGLTTWKVGHVSFSGGKARIKYVGKAGVKQDKTVESKEAVRLLKALAEGKKKDDPLFEGEDYDVRPSDVNAYLKPFGISAKDIRGLHANKEMIRALKEVRKGKVPKEEADRKRMLKEEFKKALEIAADKVGHQAGTLKGQYLIPTLEPDYMENGKIGGLAADGDILPGGKADNRPDSDFDPGQLHKGVKHELEHTDSRELAKEIAKDHLAEDPRYYDNLERMERMGRKKVARAIRARHTILYASC